MDDGPLQRSNSTCTQYTPKLSVDSKYQGTGSFFPNARDFIITGGTFTSHVTNVHYAAPTLPAGFRTIPLGDIDLQREIGFSAGVVDRPSVLRRTVRRVYSARVHGVEANMTVALYEGEQAEQDRDEYLRAHSHFRHPSIVQVFGLASFEGTHAVIAHDELLRYEDFLQVHRLSPVMEVYMNAKWASEHLEASHYLNNGPVQTQPGTRAIWIRSSTGRLCIDFTPGQFNDPSFDFDKHNTFKPSRALVKFDDPKADEKANEALPVKLYHEICSAMLSEHGRVTFGVEEEINLGGVVYTPVGMNVNLHSPLQTAVLGSVKVFPVGWTESIQEDLMDGGWTRMKHRRATRYTCSCSFMALDKSVSDWFSQSNYIFKKLGITAEHERYAFLSTVTFELRISESRISPSLSGGYLFLRPIADFQVGATSFRWPSPTNDEESPVYYWSLDPLGAHRLSTDEAHRLGFPEITLCRPWSRSSRWSVEVYEGLRKFHEAKGFDPDTQDLARQLGRPLYVPSASAAIVDVEEDVTNTCSNAAADRVDLGAPPTIAAPASEPPPQAPANTPAMLLPPTLTPGPNIPIEEFCSTYELDDDILAQFKKHKFKRSAALEFVEVSELAEMGFVKGEVAEIRAAVRSWARDG
ncbi:hypothetical protein FB45DRAFT_1008066 [Roridomyces roridus]|uniref:Uncharacterized protein n=1 Tax=Roridomyces roridus TaxID=1738132 RepID=A0AAD7BCL9_9AGAR|nr:hypothetical protein FB45DRAFT_1008066 [Roridomyces roridus]